MNEPDNSLNEQLAHQISTVQKAAEAIRGCSTPAQAREVLKGFGAVFEEDGLKFSMFDGTFRASIRGEKGEVGASKAKRAQRKRERQARKAARRAR